MIAIRKLDAHPDDQALGLFLVREYTDATAQEMDVELEEILPLIPDYDEFPGRYQSGGAFLVAEVEGEPAGCVGLAALEEQHCEMNRLWVRPEFRHLGLGQKLVEASFDCAKSLGYSRISLEVLASRSKAIALYRRLGFVDCPQFHTYDFPVVAFSRSLAAQEVL